MAKLFPTLNPADISNRGERTVARALVEHLPNRVEVFHGFNWLRRNRAGTIVEGECDFVLLDSEHGLLFVEVKGGSLVFDGREWVRIVRGEERQINKDPFAQAQLGMYHIVKLVKNQFGRAGDNLPFTYGFAVAFPDCRVTGQLPPSILPELILDAARLRQVDHSIRRIFRSFNRADHRALTDRSVESVRAALFPKYRLIPVMWRKIEDQEERLQRLTDAQQGILDILANQTRAAIQGVAGSGKTILALAKAQAIARAGTRTLFLCYNRPLKDWLRNAVSESLGDNLVIENYHGLTDVLCRQAGVSLWEMGDTHDKAFWNDVAPEALMQACERLGPEHKFDALVVDEGQDFHELWWASLESVFRDSDDKACFYVFHDPNQNLYVERPSLPPELGKPYVLPENCRNTVRIAEHCASLVGQEGKSRDGAPEGDEPEKGRAGTHPRRRVPGGRPARPQPLHAQPGRPHILTGRRPRARLQRRRLAAAIRRRPGHEELRRMGREQGRTDRLLASLQGLGGRRHRDHRNTGPRRRPRARQSLRRAIAREALADGD